MLELEAEKGLMGKEESKYQDEELRKRVLEELTMPEQDKPNLLSITALPTGEGAAVL